MCQGPGPGPGFKSGPCASSALSRAATLPRLDVLILGRHCVCVMCAS